MAASSHSDNLSFLPQPVDATNPPTAAASVGSAVGGDAGGFSNDNKVFRLYCLAFHHFDDDMAREVLASTLKTAHGFAILELQDRRPLTLLLMLGEGVLVWLTTLFWFWHDPIQLFFTYIMPILPCVMLFDGLVSCLRTRTWEEFVELVELTMQGQDDEPNHVDVTPEVVSWTDDRMSCRLGGWGFTACRDLHTWPFGYTNFIVGKRMT